jgi:hypothetical protein
MMSSERTFTRDDVIAAANAGADLVLHAMSDNGYMGSDEAYNVSNLVVCAIGSVLDNPHASVVDVLAENFQDSANQWREELGDDVVDQALARQEAT